MRRTSQYDVTDVTDEMLKKQTVEAGFTAVGAQEFCADCVGDRHLEELP